MNFGEALQALKNGFKVTRSVWGGYWQLYEEVQLLDHKKGIGCPIDKIIVAALRDGGGYAPATPYQEDLLAEDWSIVE